MSCLPVWTALFTNGSARIGKAGKNLDNIASVHRTPDEYRLEKKDLEERVRQINRRLMQLPITLQEEIAKLGKKYAARLNPLRQQATLLKVEEEQIPVKRQDLQNRRHQLEMEEQERIAQEKEIRERLFNEALLKVQSEKDAREKSESKNKKDLKELDSSFNKAFKALDEELRIFKEAQQSEAERRGKEFAAQKRQLDEQQKAELAGKGVDTILLEQYRRALEGLMEQLKRIDRERPIVIRYRDAEKNLFAREPEIKKAIKAIEQRIGKKCKEMEERQKTLLKELTYRREGLELYRQMVENEHLVPDTFLADGNTMNTELSCQQLLTQLRGTVNQKRESIDKLKDIVVSFNRNFKP